MIFVHYNFLITVDLNECCLFCFFPRQLTAFKGEAKAIKLFAKHIKVSEMAFKMCVCVVCNKQNTHFGVCLLSVQVEEQVKLLQKGVTHIGVGTPGRINALIEKGGCERQKFT